MKCSLLMLAGILSGALWTAPHAAHGQIVNPDFEGRNAVPSTRSNLGPSFVINSTTYYDDLQVWDAIPSHVSSGFNGSSTVTSYSNGGSYLSTDGIGNGSMSAFSVAPHSGRSAVLIQQHDQNADHNYDQFVTQKLANPLLAGHRYEVKFWALRTQPSVNFRTKLALYVTNASPFYDLVNGSATKYSIIPSANAKVVVSGDIQANQGWVLVSGFIDIPVTETTNQWVTIGYDRSDQYRDTSLPNTIVNGAINYLIDDASLVDVGVPTCPYNLTLTAYTADGPVQPDGNGGGVATPDNAAAGDVAVNTPVTMTVNGNGIEACIWSVYASTGNSSSSYTSSTNGTQFSITPHQPSSAKAPNGSDNYAQSYSITCTVSSTTCPQGISLQYTLYSNPPAGGGGGGGEFDPQLSQTQAQPQIATYPNPAAERILITVPANQKAQAALYNQYGELKANLPVTGMVEVPIRHLQPGIYYLKVKTSSGQSIQKRIAIQQ